MTINKASLRLECQADRYADAANHLKRMMVKQTNVTSSPHLQRPKQWRISPTVEGKKNCEEKQNILAIFVSIAISVDLCWQAERKRTFRTSWKCESSRRFNWCESLVSVRKFHHRTTTTGTPTGADLGDLCRA